MSFVAVWVDRNIAKLFRFSAEEMERKTIQSRHQDHHTHRVDSLDRRRWEHPFFQEVVQSLEPANQLLILGPGVAKHHFQNFLIEHFPAVAKRVVGCQTVDHPTDQQIAAMARMAIFGSNESNRRR